MEKNKKHWYESTWRTVGVAVTIGVGIYALQWVIDMSFAKSDSQGAATANLVSSLMGGLLALTGSFLATKMQIDSQVKTDDLKKNDEKRRLALALLAEVHVLEQFISKRTNELQEQNKKGKILSMHLSEEYFKIYDNNTSHIGLFSEECSNHLVSTYMQIKSLYDNTRTLSIIAEETTKLKKSFGEVPTESIKRRYDDKLTDYRNFVEKLVDHSANVLNHIFCLKNLLKNEK